MIAIDCRPLQDDSKFRGIGTVIRNIIEHIPNKKNYALLIEKGRGDIESFGMKVIEFIVPFNKKKYGEVLTQCLRENHIRQCHFMAQYNIPDHFDFPFSVTVHDLFNEYLLTNQKKYEKKLAPMIKQLKKAKVLIAISEYTKATIQERLPDAKVQVITNGFSASITKHATVDVNLFTTLNIQTPFILYMGNFEKRKNFLGALKGFIEFSKTHPEYQLVACTGHQPVILPPAILWLVLKHRKKIKLMPYIQSNALANLYKKAAALLFVSHAEGFGLPILEAMSVTTPVVISNTTALPEVGKNAAMYADPRDTRSIAEGLSSVIDDDQCRHELIQHMPKVLADFDVKTKALEYDQLFSLA